MAFFDVWRAENRRRDTGESQKESSVENDRKSTCRLDRLRDRSFGENRGGWTLVRARPRRGSARRSWGRRPRRATRPKTRRSRRPTCCAARVRPWPKTISPRPMSLISQAEALGVQYNLFYMGDTPKKARRDLERKRNASAAAPTKPSQMFAPAGTEQEQERLRRPIRSRAGRPIRAAGACRRRHSKLRRCRRWTSPTRSARFLPRAARRCSRRWIRPIGSTEPGENDARVPGRDGRHAGRSSGNTAGAAAHDSPLRAARLALAVGDVRRAAELVAAGQGHASSTTSRWTTRPTRSKRPFAKYQELSSLDKNTEAYRRAYARNLMEQADAPAALGRAGRGRAAGQPCGRHAGRLRTVRAEAARLAGTDCRLPPASGGGRPMPPPAAPDTPARRPRRRRASPRGSRPWNWSARPARRSPPGNSIGPNALARQAEQLRVPESAFAPGEDRPGLVLLDLRQLRLRQSSGVVPAGGQYVVPAGGNGEPDRTATRAVYDPSNDPTRNMAASSQQPAYGPDLRLAQNRQASRRSRQSAGAAAGPDRARRRRARRRAWRCSSRVKRP